MKFASLGAPTLVMQVGDHSIWVTYPPPGRAGRLLSRVVGETELHFDRERVNEVPDAEIFHHVSMFFDHLRHQPAAGEIQAMVAAIREAARR